MSTTEPMKWFWDRVKTDGEHKVLTEDGTEVIDADQFQLRMRIGRTTFHNWKKEGRLVQGKHYISVRGRTWVFWSKELLLDLSDSKPRTKQKEQASQTRALAPRNRRGGVIDLSY